MSSPRERHSAEAYWKYLEENSKVVSTWPEWLKGERKSVASDEEVKEPSACKGGDIGHDS